MDIIITPNFNFMKVWVMFFVLNFFYLQTGKLDLEYKSRHDFEGIFHGLKLRHIVPGYTVLNFLLT